LDALLRWVLGFGRHVKVLDPPDFRRRVAGALRAVAARHEPKRRKGAGNA
jgi:predicted DNA-binding transcriptional regulator YafY